MFNNSNIINCGVAERWVKKLNLFKINIKKLSVLKLLIKKNNPK